MTDDKDKVKKTRNKKTTDEVEKKETIGQTKKRAIFARQMLNMPTPKEFTSTKQGMTYLQNEAALDWLDAATGGEYDFEILDFGFHDFRGACGLEPDANTIQVEEIEGAIESINNDTEASDEETKKAIEKLAEKTTSRKMTKIKNARVPIIAWAIVRLNIPSLGVHKDGIGANVTFFKTNDKTVNGAETSIKGAVSSAFKRAVRKFGMGQDLYPNSDRASERPLLPLRGIGMLMQIMGMENDTFFEKATLVMGKSIERDVVKADPELARQVFLAMERYYIYEYEAS